MVVERNAVAKPGLTDWRFRYRKAIDKINFVAMALCTGVTVFFLVVILGYVIVRGGSYIDWSFLTSLPVPVGEKGGGIFNALVGSLIIVAVAALMALPIGVGAAVFVNEFYSPCLGKFVRFLAEVLIGVPSIVIGLFAYTIVVWPTGRFSGFSGSVAYAFIMAPIIMISAHEALRLMPTTLREASLALGIPTWKTILRVVLPTTSRAMLTGVVLAIARALGETAPMIFTAFGNPYLNFNITKPMATLPLVLFTYATSPYEDWQAQAWATAFVLVVVVLFTSILTRYFLRSKFEN